MIRIKDIEPNIFYLLLQFIDQARIEIEEYFVIDLLAAAHKYSLHDLEEGCLRYIGANICIDTVLSFYQTSLLYEKSFLSEKCLYWIQRRAEEVLKSESLLDTSEEVLYKIVQMNRLSIDEGELFRALLRWGEHHATIRNVPLKDVMEPLIKNIRFPIIDGETLITVVKNSKVVPVEMYIEALEYHASPNHLLDIGHIRFQRREMPLNKEEWVWKDIGGNGFEISNFGKTVLSINPKRFLGAIISKTLSMSSSYQWHLKIDEFNDWCGVGIVTGEASLNCSFSSKTKHFWICSSSGYTWPSGEKDGIKFGEGDVITLALKNKRKRSKDKT